MNQARCMLEVRGLDCPKEIAALRAALDGQPGIASLGFDLIHQTMTVDYAPGVVEPEALARRVRERAGMSARVLGGPEVQEEAPPRLALFWRSEHRRWMLTAGSGLALACGLALHWAGPPLGLSAGIAERSAAAAYVLAVLVAGLDLFPRAARNLARRRLDIDVLMALAVVGALVLGEWDEAATVAFLYGLSEALEAFSLDRARRSIGALLDLAPPTAERLADDGATTRVPAAQIQAGERVLVRPGNTVPIDGSIVSGRSSIDQKTITGEPLPVARGPGDRVYAGTINGEGTLEIAASGPLSEALISRVIDQVRASQAGRAPIERRINRFAAIYTPIVVTIALAVMLAPFLLALLPGGAGAQGNAAGGARALERGWFGRGLVVLVIACPCALVIATPVAVVSALAAAARAGALVRGGEHLEALGTLRALAFDKTGTLTRGRPDVVEVVCAPGHGDAEHVVRVAAALGDRGAHPLGQAIARYARGRRLDVPAADDYRAVPGLGARGRIDAEEYHMGSHRFIDEAGLCRPEFHDQMGRADEAGAIGTAVALTASTGPLGWIRLADGARPEAAAALADLHGLGLRTIMLTGDNATAAAAMARTLGIDEQRAELLPDDKARVVAELDANHGATGMVGDGVNDAPALAAARVGVALGAAASGAALETADIVLLSDDLRQLPWLVRHGRAALRVIHQNIALALGVKALVLALAVCGMANLWMAIASDVGASLVVVANALRLLRPRSQWVNTAGKPHSNAFVRPAH